MEKKEQNQQINTLQRRPLKQSTFLTEIQKERNRRITQITSGRKRMTTSDFFHQESSNNKNEIRSRLLQKDNLKHIESHKDNLKRVRSLRFIPNHKETNEPTETGATQQLKDNVVRLRLEEISFKIKTKICSLLKEISIPATQLSKFATLTKIDDILSFFSSKIREKLTASQLTEVTINRARSREKTTLSQYQSEINLLKKRNNEKDAIEKALKLKLKESNTELREVLQTLSTKESELSTRMTEIYQLKTTLKENQQTLQTVQERFNVISKEANENRNQLDSENQVISSSHKEMEAELLQANERICLLEEEIQAKEEKITTMNKINNELSQELTRWRQRFQDYSLVEDTSSRRSSIAKTEFVLPHELKKSTMSMNDYIESKSTQRYSFTALEMENLKLSNKVQELLLQNKQLSKDLEAIQTVHRQCQSTDVSKVTSEKSEEIEVIYRQKMETAAEEWKKKLIDLVNQYQDDLQTLKATIENQRKEIVNYKGEIETFQQKNRVLGSELSVLKSQVSKLHQQITKLTNERYESQCQVTKLQNEIYELLKTMKNSSSSSK